MKIKLTIGLIILLITKSLISFSNKIDIPKNFIITERLSVIGNNFNIDSKSGQKIGNIEEKIISFSTSFILYDKNGDLIAKSKETIFSLVTQIKLYDENDNYIGKIEHKIFENLFSIQNTYAIYDKYDKRLGTSRKLDLFSTSVDIYDNYGKLLVKIKRPMINFITDKWEVNIYGDIDNRLVVFIPCYKTYADNKRK